MVLTSSLTGTGPSFDHTTFVVYGHYFYLDGNAIAGPGSVARLISYSIAPGSDCSFTFYSHMYGRNIGSLRVMLRSVCC